jgi:uncharacterized membrane protein YhaH (DUF805 family)
MHWYSAAFKNYAGFSGRAQRKEYWYFYLFTSLISISLSIVDHKIGSVNARGYGLLSGIYALLVVIPLLAVTVRRFHDTDSSGWWILLGLFPFLGFAAILFFCVEDGTAGDNRYGPDPKGRHSRWS